MKRQDHQAVGRGRAAVALRSRRSIWEFGSRFTVSVGLRGVIGPRAQRLQPRARWYSRHETRGGDE
jgi:hypothetical protein